MQLFPGPDGTTLFFDNLVTQTGVAVAYDPGARRFATDRPFCANRAAIDCNWAAAEDGALCPACAMTALAPDPDAEGAAENWAEAERAKRWMLDGLGRWGWFGAGDGGIRPVFHMLAEGATPVVMGHADGVVSLSIAEADPVVRVARREALGERYRTMIGHLRHEIAHFLWWRLSLDAGFLDAFRGLFGDERADYAAALERHYADGPTGDWRAAHLTPYAAAHPHEDWAETAAHLMHLVEITDSFRAAGFTASDLPGPEWDAYRERDAGRLIEVAVRVALGTNHVNRAMGLPDLYPFVLGPVAREKLAFAHRWLSGHGDGLARGSAGGPGGA